MNNIKKLDGLTIAKISAGEVIDRPSSVVKELVENSIDAGATSIQIAVARGGLDLIQVDDNGRGIYRDDLPLALEEHATSKIQSLDDLYQTHTMGFRGEALASIRYVADVQIKSSTDDSGVGGQIESRSGRIEPVAPISHPLGTSIRVMGLFRTIPVRQKFLKSASTEFSYIYELIVGLSLVYLHIDFVLTHEQKEVLNTRGLKTIDQRAVYFWGKTLSGNLLPVEFNLSGYSISGVISKPLITFSSRSKQVFTVNGRLIKNPVIQKALSQAAADAVPSGRFLAAVIDIQAPNGDVDINIHPQKADVKFSNSGFIFDVFIKAIRLGLSGGVGPVKASNDARWPEILKGPRLAQTTAHSDVLFQAIEWNSKSNASSEMDIHSIPPSITRSFIQMFDTYILINAGDALLVLDQHAVHERILYEQIKARSDSTLYSQPLLATEVIQVTPDQHSRFIEAQGFFTELGFEVEDFGLNQIMVRQVPVSLAGPAPERLIVSILDSFFEYSDLYWDRVLFDKDKLQRMACRAAIKAGKRMAEAEVFAMIDDLIRTPSNYTCPHGRPLFLTWRKSDFEKMFLRT